MLLGSSRGWRGPRFEIAIISDASILESSVVVVISHGKSRGGGRKANEFLHSFDHPQFRDVVVSSLEEGQSGRDSSGGETSSSCLNCSLKLRMKCSAVPFQDLSKTVVVTKVCSLCFSAFPWKRWSYGLQIPPRRVVHSYYQGVSSQWSRPCH